MHCNSRQPDAAQLLSALISLHMLSLKLLSLFVAILDQFHCLYVTLLCDLELWPRDLWPLSLNICSRLASRRSNSVRNLSEIGQSAAELLQFEIWSYDLEHLSRVALCSGIVCTKFTLSQAISSWNVTVFGANTPYHAMTLTFDPLILKVCGRSGVMWS